jgi:hypothetical protein
MRFLTISFFSSNNIPWAPHSQAKAFLNSDSNSPRYDRFLRPTCIYFWSGGVGQFENIQFLIDIARAECI